MLCIIVTDKILKLATDLGIVGLVSFLSPGDSHIWLVLLFYLSNSISEVRWNVLLGRLHNPL